VWGAGASATRNGKIAFADDQGALQVVAPDGSGAEVIADCPLPPDGCVLPELAWSPDGRQIAFVRADPVRADPGLLETASLYLADSDGSVRRLAGCGSCAVQFGGHVSWSPDSSWIAFSRSGAHWAMSLWAVDTTGGKLRRLTDCRPNVCADMSPAWSPNGQSLVFSRIAGSGSALYTMRGDGSHMTKITNSAFAAGPQWSPDGREIAFDGDDQIYIVDADGSDQKLLFDGMVGSGPGVPSWSPDGTKLAFFNTPGESGNFTAEVWTMARDGSVKQRLFRSACCVMNWAAPVWSPDGKKIAFAATSADGTFVVASDGSGLRRLSTASASGLTWQRLH
jgi:Tol biopolymer transport system component